MNIINGFLEYVSPNTSPRTLNYVLCKDLDRVLGCLKDIPKRYLASSGYFLAGYYREPINVPVYIGGSASLNLFLKAPEVVEYLSQYPSFIEYCMTNNITWFFTESLTKKISERTDKHYFIELGNTEALKDFK